MSPIEDLKAEIAALRAQANLSDEVTRLRFERIEADIERIDASQRSFVARSWTLIVLVLTAAAGGIVSVLTRGATP